MAELDIINAPDDKFLEFVNSLQSEPTNEARTLPSSVLPQTREAISQIQAQAEPMQDMIGPEARRMGVKEGSFLDIRSGAPAGIRFRMGLDDNQLNQFKLLSGIYGQYRVDLSEEGRFIIRGSKPGEDLMVDPVGVEGGDAAEMASQAVPIVAGALAARLGLRGKSPFGKFTLGVLGAALGAETTGGVQDWLVREANDNEVNVPEIAKRRAIMAATDAVLGTLAAGGAKVGSTVLEGLAGVAQIPVGTTGTKEAAKKLRKQTGVNFPLTPGQESESGVLLRLESMIGGRLGSAGVVDRMREAQTAAEDELKRVFLGLPRKMSDEDLMAALPRADLTGQNALRELSKISRKVEGDVADATTDILQTGTAEAQKLARVDLSSPLESAKVGSLVRSRAVGEFNTFHDEMGSRYDAFLSRPEIQARTVPGDELAKAATAMEKKLVPKSERSGTVETIDDFVPAKVRSFTDALKNLKGAQVSVDSMKQIRTSIDNAIKEGISIPGTDVAQLQSLKQGVETAITDALKGMPDKTLLSTWNGLKKDYSAGMSQFDKQGIREMLVNQGERGSIGDTALAESIIGNSPKANDQFIALKEFLGPTSPEFESLKQVARERTLKGALSSVDDFIDGGVLRRQIDNLRPEIAEELFGANKAELNRIGEVLSRARGKVDSNELVKLAQSKSLTAQKVAALEEAEFARTTAYNNKLIKAASRGALGEERIVPSEFVRHATQMDPGQAAKVMAGLNDTPELQREIRQLAIEDLWAKSRTGSLTKEQISPVALNKALQGEKGKTQEETWRTILGDDTVESLKTLVRVTTPREVDMKKFSGSLGGQMDMMNMFTRGEVGTMKEVATRYLLGFLYSGPARRLVTNLATPTDRSRMINAVVASAPFVGGLVDRFGSDGALGAMAALRDVVEPLQKKELFIQGEIQDFDPSQLSVDEFKAWLSNTAGPTRK